MKLTTKLLLGATVVVGLSISSFAACANDVAMGGKKLTGLADGGATGEAVTYEQVFGFDTSVITEINNTAVTVTGTFGKGKGDKVACGTLDITNVSGSDITGALNLATFPNNGIRGFAYVWVQPYADFGTSPIMLYINGNTINKYGQSGNILKANVRYFGTVCFPTN